MGLFTASLDSKFEPFDIVICNPPYLPLLDAFDELGLENTGCLRIRAEDYKETVDMVVSRAVTRLDRFTSWVAGNLAREKNSTSPEGSGIWYLKGGDLEEELKPYPRVKVFDLSDVFTEPFFETKKLVWLPPQDLK